MPEPGERTPLVGRERELAAVLRRLADARQGAGSVTLLAGEAGIGKSRLAAEVKARAAEHGFTVLQGNCFTPDRSHPSAPLIDLLRTAFTGCEAGELAALLGPLAPELARLLPELTLRLPEATLPPSASQSPAARRRPGSQDSWPGRAQTPTCYTGFRHS